MRKKIIILAVVIGIIAVAAVIALNNVNQNQAISSIKDNTQNNVGQLDNKTEKEINVFSQAEVSQHNTKSDCWMIIESKVYDVTGFIALGKHPPQIEMGCGKDATRLFNERIAEDGTKIGSGKPHSKNARKLLENYYIGNLKI